jgi:hypothetical protein
MGKERTSIMGTKDSKHKNEVKCKYHSNSHIEEWEGIKDLCVACHLEALREIDNDINAEQQYKDGVYYVG